MVWVKQAKPCAKTEAVKTMSKIFKLLFFLMIVGFIGLVGYAYVGEFFGANFSPPQSETRVPVTLDTE